MARSKGEFEKIRDRLEVDGECWLWQGSIRRDGYGRVRFRGEAGLVHRVVHELLVGPIPEGRVLDHLCRRKACANPAHLEPVPQRTNVLRGGGHAITYRSGACERGHPESERYYRPNGQRSYCKACVRGRRDAK